MYMYVQCCAGDLEWRRHVATRNQDLPTEHVMEYVHTTYMYGVMLRMHIRFLTDARLVVPFLLGVINPYP